VLKRKSPLFSGLFWFGAAAVVGEQHCQRREGQAQ
jgi:hypothetical protein